MLIGRKDMLLKTLFAIIILLLIFAPMYTVLTTVFTMVSAEKFDTGNAEGGLISNGDLASEKPAMNNYLYKDTWNFEKMYGWSDFGCINDDSVELILGINKSCLSARKEIEDLAERYHGKIVNEVWMRNELQAVATDLPLPSVSLFVREIQDSKLTRYIEPNVKFQSCFMPNDPFWNLQWGSQKIAADWAWNTTIGNHEILVAVVDTGVDWNHPDLVANYVPLGYDWVNDDTDPMDDNSHGTHCAGIIAAMLNNSIGIAGMAQVRIMAEKGLDRSGSGNEDDLANAIIHAVEQNASIISMSWSGNFNNTLICEAIKFAYDSGVLLVASAGNSRSDIKSYPAAYDEVIAVSATDQQDRRAFFTNFGNWIELAAPGVQIYSTVLNNGYDYKSGTSMSCPYVVGATALVWSEFPNITRDQVRYHLRYTVDDLGDAGFDEYYGYGRINVTRAVNQFLPAHDLLIQSLKSPMYVELNNTGVFNITILNYGATDEDNITVLLLANNTYISSCVIDSLANGLTVSVNLTWVPTSEGLYNITIEMPPTLNETTVENNFIEVYVYGGTPVKAFVIRSSGTCWTWITATWEKLNKHWFEFGNTSIFIDSTTLDKKDITYEDLANASADVLIISSAYSPDFDWEFTDSEIDAISRYVYEEHGLIVTANTFNFPVPNNNKLARLLGIDETIIWNTTLTSDLDILEQEHPLFRNIPNPYSMPLTKLTTIPPGSWTEDVLVGGKYVALGSSNESAIVTYRGLVYISPDLESYANQNDLQLFYNAVTWTHYEKPEHDLIAGLEAPPFLLPNHSVQLNATVSNIGIRNETNIELQLMINGDVVANVTIPELPSNSSYTLNYLWAPEKATHNITVYALPIVNESNLLNNRVTRFVTVSDPIIQPIEGQWVNYKLDTFTGNTSISELINFTYNQYISPYQINVTYWHSSFGYKWATSSVVNVMNRRVERGTWMGLWFPGWIETNVSLGSEVRVLYGIGTIVGSQETNINRRSVEYWSLFVNLRYQNYTFYYDKATGLLIGYSRETLFFKENLNLTSTNIIIGKLIHPKTGEYARYSIVYVNNSSITAIGTMNFSYMEFLDSHRIRIQVDYSLSDTNEQLLENFTELIIVNVQTRIIESGPPSWNGTYYFGRIETSIDLASPVKIWNQTGTVIGTTKYTVEQRVFDTWLIYTTNKTQLCLCNYDKASGLLIKSTANNLNDPSQNVTSTLLQTNIDVTPPAISITDPKNNAFIRTTSVKVRWIGLDNETGIAYYLVYLDSVEVTSCQHNVSAYLYTGLTEGTHVIKVEAYDLAGNTNSAETTIVIDVTPPTAYITAPSDGNYLKGVVHIIFGGDDLWFNFMQLSINDVSEAIFFSKGNHTYLWDTTAYSDGAYIIIVEVWDNASNTAIYQITVIVDNTNPSIQIVQPATYVKNIYNVVVYAYDVNLKNVSLYVNDLMIDGWTSTGIHISVWNTTTSSDGVSTVKAKVFDKAGNNREQSIKVVVDNTPPTAEITSPTNGAYMSGATCINLVLGDENLEDAMLMIDGENIADVTNATYYQWNTTETTDGQHILMLKAVDKAGNVKTSITTVTVDNTNPIVSIISPKNNAIISGNITITFITWDKNLKNTTLVLDEATFNVTNVTALTLDTKTLQDDAYTVRLNTFDMAENQDEARITIIVDNTNPEAEISAPANGARLQGTANIYFTASDDHLTGVFLYIDDMAFNVTAQTSFQWNTTKLGDGVHLIKIVAVDSAENQKETQAWVWTINVQKATEDRYAAGRNLGIFVGVSFGLIASIVAVIAKKYLRSVKPSKAP